MCMGITARTEPTCKPTQDQCPEAAAEKNNSALPLGPIEGLHALRSKLC
jgi:hypothetical protein